MLVLNGLIRLEPPTFLCLIWKAVCSVQMYFSPHTSDKYSWHTRIVLPPNIPLPLLTHNTQRHNNTHAHTHTHTHNTTCTHAHIQTHTDTHRHTHAQTHRRTDTQTHRHTDTQTHTHRHTDTQHSTHSTHNTHTHTHLKCVGVCLQCT